MYTDISLYNSLYILYYVHICTMYYTPTYTLCSVYPKDTKIISWEELHQPSLWARDEKVPKTWECNGSVDTMLHELEISTRILGIARIC